MSWELRSHSHKDIYVPSKRKFSAYSSEILCACLSPNQQLLATGCIDGSIHVWMLDERPDKPVQLRGVTGALASAVNGMYEATGERCAAHCASARLASACAGVEVDVFYHRVVFVDATGGV
jgi:WD40 repeat protein